MSSFKALVINKIDNEIIAETKRIEIKDLPEGELLIQVAYSSVNYKDALACTANGGIVKSYPFIPGIDLAGTVVSSQNERFRAGDQVVATGYGLGVSHYGGYSEYARVPADWVLKLPQGLSMKEAMILGTAGFTAALSVYELQQNGVRPEDGPILVTGATGGVGSVASDCGKARLRGGGEYRQAGQASIFARAGREANPRKGGARSRFEADAG